MRVRKDLIGLIATVQSVLLLTHYLLYETWTFSPAGGETPGALWIKLVLGFLSVSFVAASLLAFRYTNAALRAFYKIAAVWMGLVLRSYHLRFSASEVGPATVNRFETGQDARISTVQKLGSGGRSVYR